MTSNPAQFRSCIHFAGTPWEWTQDASEELERMHEEDATAYDQLMARYRRAYRKGLQPTSNNSNRERGVTPTHRCPVGEDVEATIRDHEFTDDRPKPWTGELYAEGYDASLQYRLYFIEARARWDSRTHAVVGCGVGSKRSDGTTPYDDQTRDIYSAMHRGVTWCTERPTRWRRWSDA